ncbi:hypothetical protein GRJ2_003017800 [Grus japonensis]|uniref:SGNH hydrolase-type esterase domain-containing protein n=1 Tax=Grus japonensis TaxID=30415 RepID=A0ABC9Y943_GRUJA
MEVDRWFRNQVPVADTTENEASWTLVTHKSRTPFQSPHSSFTTKNRYEALTAVDTHEQGPQGETAPAAHSGYRKKKRRVLVVGDPLLRGTKVPICQPDRESQEVCCLLGAKIQDVAERVPQLVKSTDYYPLLLFHVGMNDTASRNLGRIKEDYKALGVQDKNIGAQVLFSSILPVGGKGAARNRSIMHINSWLCGWCRHKGFGFYNNRTFFDDYNLLGRDGIHLSGRGKAIFGSRLANLVRSWRTGEVPEDWRKANVTLVFKKGKKEDPGNYRTVSLTSITGKVMEQLILGVTSKHVEENKVIGDGQHGFTREIMLDQSESHL